MIVSSYYGLNVSDIQAMNQEKEPHPTMLATWSQMPQPPQQWKLNFCCV